eukprot:Nitzschia sp. Nitz4//scaffold22_size323478//52257//53597//NITZ4_000506-RA/size323478-processed-gene-0.447-mRNA-1//-1//CDS//3329542932//5754//frame0
MGTSNRGHYLKCLLGILVVVTGLRFSFETRKVSERQNIKNILTGAQNIGTQSFLVPSEANETIPHIILPAFGNDTDHPLRNCSATTQIRIYHSPGTNDTWILQALDSNGKPKTIGGDEFYISYLDYEDPAYSTQARRKEPTAVAAPQDLGDGTYSLKFFVPPTRFTPLSSPHNLSGRGELTVEFQYTCFIGSWDRNAKNGWISNGASRASVTVNSSPAPPVTVFEYPFRNQINFSEYGYVSCYGDSLINHFCNNSNWEKLQGLGKPPLSSTKVGLEYSMDRVDQILANISQVHKEIPDAFQDKPKLLILGSHTWDVLDRTNQNQNIYYDDHILAVRTILQEVPKRYPDWKILWKSPQAFHVQKLPSACYQEQDCRSRTRDLSMHWPSLLYQRQSKLVQELEVPMVDLFLTTYLAGFRATDGRHYQIAANGEWMHALGGFSIQDKER